MISNDVKLLAVYDKLEKQIKALQLKHGVDGKDGADGISIKGDRGDRGHDGIGHEGKQGVRGADGTDGTDGSDGVSITTAKVDFDNHLVITLSDGTEIDAGELKGGSGGDQYFRSGSKVNVNTNVAQQIVYVTDATQLSGALDPTKLYFLDGQIDLGAISIVVPLEGLSLAGHGFGISGLVSSGANHTMFVTDGVNRSGDLFLTSMDITCTGVGSKVFDLDNEENFKAMEWNTVNFLSCTSLGEVKNYRQGLGRNIAWISCDDGLTMTGNWSGGFAIIDSIVVGAPFAGVLFKAGTALVIGGSFRSNINILGLGGIGGVFCDFAPANITLDAGFTLTGVRAAHASGALPNMPASSTKALIRNCVGIANTYAGAAHIPTADSLVTISAIDTLYQLTGTMTLIEAYWFSASNTNGLKLDSAHYTEVNCSGTMSFAGSNNREVAVQLRKYDNALAAYVNIGPAYRTTLNGGVLGTRSENVSFHATTNMAVNDRIEVWVKNLTDTSNITVLAGGQFQVFER